jgi:hypothetical protein
VNTNTVLSMALEILSSEDQAAAATLGDFIYRLYAVLERDAASASLQNPAA